MPALNYEKKMESLESRIEETEMPEESKELLREFERDLKVQDYSKARIYKLLTYLRIMGERMEVGFGEASEDDLKDLVAWVNSRDLAEASKTDYRIVIKRFYRWLNGGEHPEKVEWITTTLKKKNSILPRKMLDEDDVRDLLEAALNPRDRALVSILWETGARIGELMDAEIGDLEDHRLGRQIVIDGKTGPRRLPLISSVPHLQAWLNAHPRRDEGDAPLFVNIGTTNKGERMEHRAILKALNEMGERAGVDKPVNPHHFRHSRATHLASRFTEAQMCEWFGWVQGSDQPARYVHLSGRDIDSDYARMHGMEDEGEPEESKLAPEDCPRCGAKNDPRAKFCQRCGLALDEGAAIEAGEKRVLGEMTLEKAEEIEAEGTLDGLIERAVGLKLREILTGEEHEGEPPGETMEVEKAADRPNSKGREGTEAGGSLREYIERTVQEELQKQLDAGD